jgi:hypothetical protein
VAEPAPRLETVTHKSDTVPTMRLQQGLIAMLAAFSILATFGCGDQGAPPPPRAEALVAPGRITRAGRQTPEGVTLQLWRAVQVGDAASAAGFYDSRVLKAIGFDRVSGALAQQRDQLEVLRPKTISGATTALGVEVVVKGENTVAGTREPTSHVLSFLLRRSPQGWRVAYDTLLGDALPAYVYSQVQERVAPGSNKPTPEAQIAARKIGDLYRGLFSPSSDQPQAREQSTARQR